MRCATSKRQFATTELRSPISRSRRARSFGRARSSLPTVICRPASSRRQAHRFAAGSTIVVPRLRSVCNRRPISKRLSPFPSIRCACRGSCRRWKPEHASSVALNSAIVTHKTPWRREQQPTRKDECICVKSPRRDQRLHAGHILAEPLGPLVFKVQGPITHLAGNRRNNSLREARRFWYLRQHGRFRRKVDLLQLRQLLSKTLLQRLFGLHPEELIALRWCQAEFIGSVKGNRFSKTRRRLRERLSSERSHRYQGECG